MSAPEPADPPCVGSAPLPGWLAVSLVMATSAAVLVLEILAGRLLAPYVGVTLETYTGIIGTVLVGIAIGARLGGLLADRLEPRRLLPVLVMLGGALAIASIPVLRVLGRSGGAGAGRIVVLAACAFLPAATVLSAVPPAVVKLQLRDLAHTGSTVGRLSAYGTAGAIGGTFLTGFVLVTWAATSTLVVGVGLALVVGGAVLGLATARKAAFEVLAVGSIASLGLVGVITVDNPCQFRSRYYCIAVEHDPARPTGRVLVVDDLRHSYVDLADPTHLEFWYARRVADALAIGTPPGPLRVAYLGGGGFTLPRYVRAVRPGSSQTVFEIDADLVALARTELGFVPGDDIAVVVGDGRLGLRGLPDDSVDVVVGDAFGSRAVPWHLTTREFVSDIARVLRPGGMYVVNVIDEPGQLFLRAETATIAGVLPEVLVVLGPQAAAGRLGNAVVIGSDRPLDVAAVRRALAGADEGGAVVADLAAYTASAPILTDDFAPVDQLIARGG